MNEIGSTHKRCADRNHLPLVPRLYDWGIDSFDRITEPVEVAGYQFVVWELLVEDIEELHQSRRYVFRHAQ